MRMKSSQTLNLERTHCEKEPAGDGQLCSITNRLAASVSSLSSAISSNEGEPMDRTRINAEA